MCVVVFVFFCFYFFKFIYFYMVQINVKKGNVFDIGLKSQCSYIISPNCNLAALPPSLPNK